MTQKDQLKEILWKSLSQFDQPIKSDITLPGRIKAVLGNHAYTVQVGGAAYDISTSTDLTFSVNEAVWVTVPQGSYSSMFICGRRR